MGSASSIHFYCRTLKVSHKLYIPATVSFLSDFFHNLAFVIVDEAVDEVIRSRNEIEIISQSAHILKCYDVLNYEK